MTSILNVTDLTTRFYTRAGVVKAVNGISFSIDEAEIVAVVGESGCGKSVTMRSVMRIIPEPPGKIEKGAVIFNGQDLLKLDEDSMRKIRGKNIAMIFQDPMTSLNPVLTIGQQITETLQEHMDMGKNQAQDRAIELLELVGIPNAKKRINEYPYQFSGGMRQRAMIAMALSCNPELLIADEPTTALDVTIQAQITDLVTSLQQQFGMAVIWITHDLGVVARLAQRTLVMYAGYIVEQARVKDLFARPKHPYTMGLLASLPRMDHLHKEDLTVIPGQPPNQLALPQGCPFADRCSYVIDKCIEENPILEEIEEGHWAACWKANDF